MSTARHHYSRRAATLLVGVLTVIAIVLWRSDLDVAAPETSAHGDAALAAAFAERADDVQVRGEGVVVHILPDDNEGSRHQKFLLELGSGQTLLIAHNIDLAPRIADLRRGDRVAFHGEYKWNEKGGLVHWTHHDPRGIHVDGWLRHNGRTYQ